LQALRLLDGLLKLSHVNTEIPNPSTKRLLL
jgi:hypothetical protein